MKRFFDHFRSARAAATRATRRWWPCAVALLLLGALALGPSARTFAGRPPPEVPHLLVTLDVARCGCPVVELWPYLRGGLVPSGETTHAVQGFETRAPEAWNFGEPFPGIGPFDVVRRCVLHPDAPPPPGSCPECGQLNRGCVVVVPEGPEVPGGP